MRTKYLTAALAVAVSLLGTITYSQQIPMTEKIAAALKQSGQLTDYRIGVKYEDGVVTLAGTVTSSEQLKTAVRLTEQMYGVKQVTHNLKIVESQSAHKPTPRQKKIARSINADRSPTLKRPSQLSNMLSKLKQPTHRLANYSPKQSQRNKKSLKLKQPASQLPAKSSRSTPPTVHVANSMLQAKRPPSPPEWKTTQPKPATNHPVRTAKALPHEGQLRSASYPTHPHFAADIAYAKEQPAYPMPAPMTRRGAYPANPRVPMPLGYAQPQPAGNMPVPMARLARRGSPQVPLQPAGLRHGGARPTNYMQAAPCMPPNGASMHGPGMGPMPMANVPGGGVRGASYDQSNMPGYAWPSYASYPNYAALTYPRQYSPTAWPYIGPFYPYPQVPLGWRKVALEWDDGWWFLDFNDAATH